ncbi:hypothetical protein GOBAR_AA05385 [Gossypium barbadense]|uniref:Sororin C-terminal region domain-containing protein n=1 Tax=Gossypium barbadense TaxID=3634 RepID=A0A2P5YHW0_GOSBA|nr:hypothetical protein GOBAR_AA05385 [Gossypium barbadense]
MEETTKPRRKASNRKPLTDLTNTIPSSLPFSQSSSASIKTQIKSSHPSDLKSLPSNPNTSLKRTSKLTPTDSTKNINNNNNDKKENEICPSDNANPSSKPSPPSKTPSVSDFEPCTVYRRRTAKKKKSKGKEVAEPLSSLFETRTPSLRKKKDEDGDIGISKSCPMPCKKGWVGMVQLEFGLAYWFATSPQKQCRDKAEINASKVDLPQDFINKQRAYFAEVDAFELEEEVASVGWVGMVQLEFGLG